MNVQQLCYCRKICGQRLLVPTSFNNTNNIDVIRGMGDECRRALQRAAGKIASKRKENYADVMGHISTRIRMCILRTVLMSVRGSRGTSKGTSKPISSVSFNLIPGIEDLKDIEN